MSNKNVFVSGYNASGTLIFKMLQYSPIIVTSEASQVAK